MEKFGSCHDGLVMSCLELPNKMLERRKILLRRREMLLGLVATKINVEQ